MNEILSCLMLFLGFAALMTPDDRKLRRRLRRLASRLSFR